LLNDFFPKGNILSHKGVQARLIFMTFEAFIE